VQQHAHLSAHFIQEAAMSMQHTSIVTLCTLLLFLLVTSPHIQQHALCPHTQALHHTANTSTWLVYVRSSLSLEHKLFSTKLAAHLLSRAAACQSPYFEHIISQKAVLSLQLNTTDHPSTPHATATVETSKQRVLPKKKQQPTCAHMQQHAHLAIFEHLIVQRAAHQRSLGRVKLQQVAQTHRQLAQLA
jgi:hypothetical protein